LTRKHKNRVLLVLQRLYWLDNSLIGSSSTQ